LHRGLICSSKGRIGARGRVLTSTLELKYHLSKAAIDECIAEAVTNPAYSILAVEAKDRRD
jgi:hypothetical protein